MQNPTMTVIIPVDIHPNYTQLALWEHKSRVNIIVLVTAGGVLSNCYETTLFPLTTQTVHYIRPVLLSLPNSAFSLIREGHTYDCIHTHIQIGTTNKSG